MNTSPKNLFTKYFKDNDENMKSLDNASFAYHMDHDSHKKAHYFKSGKMYRKSPTIHIPENTVTEYSFDNGETWGEYPELIKQHKQYLVRSGICISKLVVNDDNSITMTLTDISISGKSRTLNFASNIDDKFKSEECYWCGRSRSDVRWSDESPECSSHKNLDITQTILDEEVKMYSLLNSGKELIPKILDSKFDGIVSPDSLIFLQTTHGFSPDIVSTILDIDVEKHMQKYEELMGIHKAKSGNMFKV